jgi:hypothetical protein
MGGEITGCSGDMILDGDAMPASNDTEDN